MERGKGRLIALLYYLYGRGFGNINEQTIIDTLESISTDNKYILEQLGAVKADQASLQEFTIKREKRNKKKRDEKAKEKNSPPFIKQFRDPWQDVLQKMVSNEIDLTFTDLGIIFLLCVLLQKGEITLMNSEQKPLNLNNLSKMLGRDRDTLRPSIDRLVDAGIMIKETHGKSNSYKISPVYCFNGSESIRQPYIQIIINDIHDNGTVNIN